MITPYQAYQSMLKGEVALCKLKEIKGKTCAEMILPYPPGIPVVLPGEKITEESQAILDFLLVLCDIGEHLPGLETDIHGAWKEADGEYYTTVVKS
jgi:lysine decarboxylase